ncbi:hypothetical protein [Burkholderia anthina]|uniref:hypothetical protein n=1 Tax=Burkholderia anthina TaxID=179879 RepID=UPI00158D1EEF|nr:hypothetical protein [Burkholderia anthina]
MKIVYVFNDRRPTDRVHPIAAISEDGIVVGIAEFDDWTLPFARFTMQVDSECDAPGSDVFLIAQARAETKQRMDTLFGDGERSAVWLEEPAADPGWIKAVSMLRAEQDRQEVRRQRALDVISKTVIDWLPTADEIDTIVAPAAAPAHPLH